MNPSKDILNDEQIRDFLKLGELENREVVLLISTNDYTSTTFNSLPGVVVETRALVIFFNAFGITTIVLRNWKTKNIFKALLYVFKNGTKWIDRCLCAHCGHGVNFGPIEQIIDGHGDKFRWDDVNDLLQKFDRIIIGNHCRNWNPKYVSTLPSSGCNGDYDLTKVHGKSMAKFSVANPGKTASDKDMKLVDSLAKALKNMHGKGDLVELLHGVFHSQGWDYRVPSGIGWWPIEKSQPCLKSWNIMRPIDLTEETQNLDPVAPPCCPAPLSSPPALRPGSLVVISVEEQHGESSRLDPSHCDPPAPPNLPESIAKRPATPAVSRQQDDVRRHSSRPSSHFEQRPRETSHMERVRPTSHDEQQRRPSLPRPTSPTQSTMTFDLQGGRYRVNNVQIQSRQRPVSDRTFQNASNHRHPQRPQLQRHWQLFGNNGSESHIFHW